MDTPPYINPLDVSPTLTDGPAVVFNLANADRTRQFQVLGVYDWFPNDILTYAWVLRIGTGDQISIPSAANARPQLSLSPDQDVPYVTRYQSSQLGFDPCDYRDVVDGVATYGTLQIVVYDTNNSEPPPDTTNRQHAVHWTWPLEFHGLCPTCTTNNQCLSSEQCVEGLCVPR